MVVLEIKEGVWKKRFTLGKSTVEVFVMANLKEKESLTVAHFLPGKKL